MKNIEIENVSSRRAFLKKMAYTAPMVVTLGALTAPMTAGASVFTNYTQSVPETDPVSYTSVETIVTQDGTNNVIAGTSDHIPTASYDNYVLTGEQVKEAVAAEDASWTWVDGIFGSSTSWNGL